MSQDVALRRALCGVAILLIAAIPVITGCDDFFIPVCQANNDCSTTTTSTPPTNSSSRQTLATGAANSFVYVSNAHAGTLSGFSVADSDVVHALAPLATVGAAPSAVAAIPAGNFVYVATTAGSIYAYAIAHSGALQLGNGNKPVASVSNPAAMSVDPSGNWLLVVSSDSKLQSFKIDTAQGTLQPAAQPTISLDAGPPTQIYFTPNCREVIVDLGAGGMDAFAFDASTGTLGTRRHTSTVKAGISSDTAIASDGTSKYLFVGETGLGIRVFEIGSNGALGEIPGSPFASPLSNPSSLAVDAMNSYLYAADRMANRIAGYAIGSTGALRQLSNSPFPARAAAIALFTDPNGKHLLAVSNRAGFAVQTWSFDNKIAGRLDAASLNATGAGTSASTTVGP